MLLGNQGEKSSALQPIKKYYYTHLKCTPSKYKIKGIREQGKHSKHCAHDMYD